MKNRPQPHAEPAEPQGGPRMHYSAPHYAHYADPIYYGHAAYSDETEEGIDLLRLLLVALRHWKTLILSLVLALGIGLLYLHFATPVYQAESLMEMSVRKPRLVKESAVIEEQAARLDTDMIFNTRLAKFQSRAMLSRVAVALQQAGFAKDQDTEALMQELKESTEWAVRRKSFIVEVGVRSPDPLFARTAANLYADSAVEMMIEENRASSDNAVAWLQQQANQQKAVLAAAEQAIVDYRTGISLDALRNKKRVSEESLIQLNETLIRLESKLITDRALLRYLEKIKADPAAAETVPAGIVGTDQLEIFISSWWEARLELSRLEDRYTEHHPDVKQAAAKLSQMRTRLDDYLSTLLGTVKNGVNLLETQVEDIHDRIEEETGAVLAYELEIVKSEGQLNSLERAREAADTSYRAVLSRIEESRMAADENTAVLKPLQAAETPEHPVAPRRLVVLALALLLGGMLGYTIAWLIELLEDKLAGIQDVERLGVEMLTLIPRQPQRDRIRLATLCLQDKFSHVSETFASLRTILTYDEARERYRCLLVSSTQPEEGKTIIAANLAIVMAQSGRKTLLIDFDLRRPQLRSIFPEGKTAESLLHLLDGKRFDAFDTLPVGGGHENLSIITSRPSGKISPAEVIGGEGPGELIRWARENYDCIIIDSPPLGVVGDSQSIADHVDGVILAARPEYTRKRALRHTIERMAAVNTNVIGVVLNDVQIRRHARYAGNYYHYGSYHAYGSYRAGTAETADEESAS